MNIDRCYCYQKTFSEIKEVAETTGADSVEGLQQHVEFGLNCGLCHPYVRRMLRTGDTSFSRIIRDEDEPEAEAAE